MKWLRALLRKLNPPKPVTPDSKWPDLLDPWQYQNKLMKGYEPQNMDNHRQLIQRIEQGAKIISSGKVEGPYTTMATYRLDDGSEYRLVWRSSLHWVEPLFPS